jgi:hypothetical protein
MQWNYLQKNLCSQDRSSIEKFLLEVPNIINLYRNYSYIETRRNYQYPKHRPKYIYIIYDSSYININNNTRIYIIYIIYI